MLLSNNFDVSFVVSDNSSLVYTPRELHLASSFKLNLFRIYRQKNQNLKEIYPFEFSKKSFGFVDRTKPYPEQNSSA